MATHNSPLGRPIDIVEGDGDGVEQRGHQITTLGEIMREGYKTVHGIVTHGLESEMTGDAVEKLAEACREVQGELDLAATLYEEVGPYVRDYGTVLSSVRTRMLSIVPEAEELWEAYQRAIEDYEQALHSPVPSPSVVTAPGTPAPEPDPEAVEQAEQLHEQSITGARSSRDAAYELWAEKGDEFDEQYDTWHEAFEIAVTGIRTEIANGIQDDWKDNFDGFVAAALKVLQVAGIVLGVLALVIGGPIVAALGALVGVLALLGTIWQFSRGDANGLDLALAIVGVIPFGAIGESFSAFRAGGNGLTAGFRSWMSVSKVSGNSGLWADISTSFMDDGARWLNAAKSGSQFGTVITNGGQTISTFTELVSGKSSEMWATIGDLGSMGEQALYAFEAPVAFAQNVMLGNDIYHSLFGSSDSGR